MARITINDVLAATKQSQIYDLVNAVRNDPSTRHLKDLIPLASLENVADVGYAITVNQQTQNDFVHALVNRIGLVIIKYVVLQNPLAKFKGGRNELGDTIEEIFVDLTKAHIYDAETAESEVFKREIPDVKALYHKLNRKEFYKQTIQRKDLQAAFTSWEKFGSFVAGIMQTLHNSNALDEYKYMKTLFDIAMSKGHMNVVQLIGDGQPGSTATNVDLVKQARATYMKMTMPQGSRNYNSLAVHTVSEPEDVYMFITADRLATIDTEVLAAAFNLDKVSFMGKVIVMETLGEGVEAIMVDSSFFMVFDTVYQVESLYNPQGLYYNYWLHVWQTISASRFANAVAFTVDSEEHLTSVIVSPSIASQKALVPIDYSIYVRQVQKPFDPPVAYTLSAVVKNADTGATISTGVTVTFSPNQKTMTVTIGGAVTAKNILIEVSAKYKAGQSDEEVVMSTAHITNLSV